MFLPSSAVYLFLLRIGMAKAMESPIFPEKKYLEHPLPTYISSLFGSLLSIGTT